MMKKVFFLFVVLLMCATTWAKGAEIIFSEKGYSDKQVIKTVNLDNGIKITFSDAKYYNSGSALRLYAKCKMTVTASDTISSINLTLPDKEYQGNFKSEYVSIHSKTWSNTTNSQARISKIVITLAGGDTVSVGGVSLSPASVNLQVGETAVLTPTIIPSNATNKNVSWSAKYGYASVTDGTVLGVSEGTDTITCTTEDGGFTARCVVTVARPEKLKGTIYNKVLKLDSLIAGDTVVILCESAKVAAGTHLKTSGSSSYLDTVAVRLLNNQATADSALQLVVGKNGTYYTFTTINGRTLGAHAEKYIDLGSTTGTNNWTISLDAKGNASIKADLTSKVYLQYNTQNPRFTCYDGKQTTVQIYKKSVQRTGDIHVENVYLNKTSLPLRKGNSEQLIAVISPATADNQKVSWTSSETSVANVVNGLVTALATGETTITVTTDDGGKQATCLVTVTDSIHVSGIQLSHKMASIKEHSSLQLSATILPVDADNQTVHWTSMDESIASVNQNGLVTAARYGQTSIIVSSDEFPVLQDTCVLTVTALQGDRYHLMTKDSILNDGDWIVFYNASEGTASAGLVDSKKYLKGVSVTKAGADLVISESQPILLTKNGTYWTLSINDNPIGHASTSENSVDFNGSSSDFTITIDDNDVATVQSQTSAKPKFYCNNSGDYRLYNSTSMSPIQIYRKVKSPDVPVAVESVELDYSALTLRAGQTDQLSATVLPEEAKNKNVIWGSVDTTIATINDGVISAVKKGETKVWVKTEDGGYTDSCVVTVLASLDQPDVTWNQLQSLDSLKEGTRVFFASVRANEDYVMGLYNYDVAKSNIPGTDATFRDDRHQVTASESYAYTVKIDNGKYVFVDLDGDYLCDYSGKNLSAQSTIDNKSRWSAQMTEDFAFLFTNVYNTGYVIYNNHNSNMFCCYNAFDKSNMSYVAIYADNAPEWVEPVRVPELHILLGKDTVTNLVDFGDVIYDDSWGTEVNPYEAAKTLSFSTKWINDSIYLSLHKGTAFTLYTDVLRPAGGTASIQFSTDTKGVYTDTLYVSCANITRKILLTATAKTEEETKPAITFSTKQVQLKANADNNYSDIASFTFSTKNMKKNLYIKWENTTGNSIPQGENDEVEILAGDEYVYYGQATNMGSTDLTNTEVLLSLTAYTKGTYTSTLLFYTIDELDKEKHAFDERVTITIVVDPIDPSAIDEVSMQQTVATKLIHNDQLLIYRNGIWYTVNGQIVNK